MIGKKIKVINPTEDQEQTKFVVWLTKKKIRFYAIPNGGSRNLFEAMKLKRTGVQPGVPDICIPIPSGQYHGLYIEMKRKKGGIISESQKDWMNFLRNNGYCSEITHGFDEACHVVLTYFSSLLPAA
jgi:hypothetical protein